MNGCAGLGVNGCANSCGGQLGTQLGIYTHTHHGHTMGVWRQCWHSCGVPYCVLLVLLGREMYAQLYVHNSVHTQHAFNVYIHASFHVHAHVPSYAPMHAFTHTHTPPPPTRTPYLSTLPHAIAPPCIHKGPLFSPFIFHQSNAMPEPCSHLYSSPMCWAASKTTLGRVDDMHSGWGGRGARRCCRCLAIAVYMCVTWCCCAIPRRIGTSRHRYTKLAVCALTHAPHTPSICVWQGGCRNDVFTISHVCILTRAMPYTINSQQPHHQQKGYGPTLQQCTVCVCQSKNGGWQQGGTNTQRCWHQAARCW